MQQFNREILYKFLRNETNPAESEAINGWLSRNKLTKDELITYLNVPEGVNVFYEIDANKDWKLVRKQIFRRKQLIPMRHFLRAAASIALLLAVSGIIYTIYKTVNKPITISNYSNNIINIVLPDSSELSLCRNSKLTYSNNFGKNRTLTMDGKIFFKVKHDPTHPFIIKAFQSSIKVLGTSFLIESNAKNTQVTVTTGRVAFYTLKQNCDTLILVKNEKGVYSNEKQYLQKSANDDSNYLSWKTHSLFFNKTPMIKVVKDLESYFDIKISVATPAIYSMKYTSEFKNPTFREVIKEMELVLNLKTKVIGKNLIIEQQ